MSAAIAASIAGPLIGGLIGSNASSNATNAEVNAANTASQTQLQMFDQIQKNLQPYMTTGGYGNSLLAAFLGVPYQTQTADQIRNSLLPQFTTTSQPSPGVQPAAIPQSPAAPQTSAAGQAPAGVPQRLWDLEHGIDPDATVTVYNGTGNDQDTGRSVLVSQLAQIAGIGGSPSGPTSTVDYNGLNAAVQNALAKQNAMSGVASSIQGMGLKPFVYDESTDPMAQTMLKFGSDAIANQRSALGGVNSGTTLKALSDYGQQTAASSYQQEYNNYYNNLTRIFDMLSGVSSSGQNAAAGVGNAALSTGNSVASNILGSGNAQAAGIVAGANSLSGGLQSMFNNPMWLSSMSGTGSYGVPSSTLNLANATSDPIGSLISSMPNWNS